VKAKESGLEEKRGRREKRKEWAAGFKMERGGTKSLRKFSSFFQSFSF
jgi:hypothetical protein